MIKVFNCLPYGFLMISLGKGTLFDVHRQVIQSVMTIAFLIVMNVARVILAFHNILQFSITVISPRYVPGCILTENSQSQGHAQ